MRRMSKEGMIVALINRQLANSYNVVADTLRLKRVAVAATPP